MSFFPFSKKKIGIGLDLGHRWTKVIKLRDKKGIPFLERMGRTFWTKDEKEEPLKVSNRIKKMWGFLLIKEKEIITSLAGHSVIIKRIPLSTSDFSGNYEEIIKKQAKEHIPFDLQNVYLDYSLIEGDKPPQEYFLVATKKEEVHYLQDMIEKADLKISIIDVDGFALCNCFEFNYPELLDNTTYLLDIGSSSSIFCVYSRGNPLIIRDGTFGGDQVTNTIKKVLGCSFYEAEKIKYANFKDISSEYKLKLSQNIKELYLTWIDEIQKLIYFHASNYEEQEVKKILLSGGGALCKELKPILEQYLEQEIDFFNPFKKINVSINNFDPEYIKEVSPQFVIAVGLALRNIY